MSPEASSARDGIRIITIFLTDGVEVMRIMLNYTQRGL